MAAMLFAAAHGGGAQKKAGRASPARSTREEMQGIHIAQMAATLRPGLPVLYMSAYTRNTIVNAGRIEESVDYLEKPFTAENLAYRIRGLLGPP
jgi:DNA-binding NtrC family response regulator